MAAAGVAMAGVFYVMGGEQQDGPDGKKAGATLASRMSEGAVKTATVVAEPWSEKGHPQFGRELKVALPANEVSEPPQEGSRGARLRQTMSEGAVKAATVVAEPWGPKAHPQFGRELNAAMRGTEKS